MHHSECSADNTQKIALKRDENNRAKKLVSEYYTIAKTDKSEAPKWLKTQMFLVNTEFFLRLKYKLLGSLISMKLVHWRFRNGFRLFVFYIEKYFFLHSEKSGDDKQ